MAVTDVGARALARLLRLLPAAAGARLLWWLAPPVTRTGLLWSSRSSVDPTQRLGYPAADELLTRWAIDVVWLLVAWLAAALLSGLAAQLPGAAGRLSRAAHARLTPAAARAAVAALLGAGAATAALSPALAAGATGPGSAGTAVVGLGWPTPPSAPALPSAAATVSATASATGSARRQVASGQRRERPPVRSAPVGRVVVVEAGDSLWELTARELTGPVDPARIEASWPMLWQRNRATIGADPGLIEVGQQLTVPTGAGWQ